MLFECFKKLMLSFKRPYIHIIFRNSLIERVRKIIPGF